MTGPIDGMQAEYVRVPYASVTCVKLPDSVTDEQAIMISAIFPTGYFGADIADVLDGDAVAVFGCGPVGQFAIISAFIMGAGRMIAVDRVPDRLEMARAQGAQVVNFDEEDPVGTVQELTGGIGVDRVIEAVGVDAESTEPSEQFEQETGEVAPATNPQGDNWHPGGAPSQSARWATQAVCKAGTIGVIRVFPPQAMNFPIGTLQQRNLTVRGGNCNHRRYTPNSSGSSPRAHSTRRRYLHRENRPPERSRRTKRSTSGNPVGSRSSCSPKRVEGNEEGSRSDLRDRARRGGRAG
jgi:threonine dehydrogenase-like Zn-dependent dehydrogenase